MFQRVRSRVNEGWWRWRKDRTINQHIELSLSACLHQYLALTFLFRILSGTAWLVSDLYSYIPILEKNYLFKEKNKIIIKKNKNRT